MKTKIVSIYVIIRDKENIYSRIVGCFLGYDEAFKACQFLTREENESLRIEEWSGIIKRGINWIWTN